MSAFPFPSASNVSATLMPSPPPQIRWTILDVSNASEEALGIIRVHGARVDEDIGWGKPSPRSTSTSPASDSSADSPTYWGPLEPASAGVSRAAKEARNRGGRKKAASGAREKRTGSSVGRPLNAYIIFRREFCRADKWKPVREAVGKQQTVSQVASNYWNGFSDAQKQPYKEMQTECERLHKEKNPGYTFQPKRRAPVKKRVNKSKELDKARVAYIAELGAKNFPVEEVTAEVERYMKEFQAKLEAARATSSASVSPAESPRTLEDPLHPPGDRTPQPRSAQPAVITLAPAPSTASTHTYAADAWVTTSGLPPPPAPMASLPIQDSRPMPDHEFQQCLQDITQIEMGASSFSLVDPYFGQSQLPIQQEQLFSSGTSLGLAVAVANPFSYEQPAFAAQFVQQVSTYPAWDANAFQEPLASIPAYDSLPTAGMQQLQQYDAQAGYYPAPNQIDVQAQYYQAPPPASMCSCFQHTGNIQCVHNSGYPTMDTGAMYQQNVSYEQQLWANPGAPYSNGTSMDWSL